MAWGSFVSNLYNGKTRKHADGRIFEYHSDKGVWKVQGEKVKIVSKK